MTSHLDRPVQHEWARRPRLARRCRGGGGRHVHVVANAMTAIVAAPGREMRWRGCRCWRCRRALYGDCRLGCWLGWLGVGLPQVDVTRAEHPGRGSDPSPHLELPQGASMVRTGQSQYCNAAKCSGRRLSPASSLPACSLPPTHPPTPDLPLGPHPSPGKPPVDIPIINCGEGCTMSSSPSSHHDIHPCAAVCATSTPVI